MKKGKENGDGIYLEYERQEYKHSMKFMMVIIKLVFSTNDEAHKEDHCDDEFEKTKFNDNNETLKFVVCTQNKTMCRNK